MITATGKSAPEAGGFDRTLNTSYFHSLTRGISAVGSAQQWQCWGQGFESPMLHHKSKRGCPQGVLFLIYRQTSRPNPRVFAKGACRVLQKSPSASFGQAQREAGFNEARGFTNPLCSTMARRVDPPVGGSALWRSYSVCVSV